MRIKVYLLLTYVIVCSSAYAQKPWTEKIEGEATVYSFSFANCQIQEMTILYRLFTHMGEPAILTNLKWRNGPGTATNCLLSTNFELFIQITAGSYGEDFLLEGDLGVVPDGNNTWGSNLAGSPNYNKLLVKKYQRLKPFQTDRQYEDEAKAKSVWKTPLHVTGLLLVDKQGNEKRINVF